jgi:hypothetical protein
MPSGYVQLPLWFVTAMFGCLILIIGYVWHRMDKRVDYHGESIKKSEQAIKESAEKIAFNTGRLDKLNKEGEESMKADLEKGGLLTLKEHGEMCNAVCSNFAKMLGERFDTFEKTLNLKLENIRLSLLAEGKRVERRSVKREKKSH